MNRFVDGCILIIVCFRLELFRLFRERLTSLPLKVNSLNYYLHVFSVSLLSVDHVDIFYFF